MLKNYPYRDQDAGNPGGDNSKRLAQINQEREALEMNAQAMRKYNEIGKQTYSEINDLSKRFSEMASDEAFALEKSNSQLRSRQDLLAAAAKNERINCFANDERPNHIASRETHLKIYNRIVEHLDD